MVGVAPGLVVVAASRLAYVAAVAQITVHSSPSCAAGSLTLRDAARLVGMLQAERVPDLVQMSEVCVVAHHRIGVVGLCPEPDIATRIVARVAGNRRSGLPSNDWAMRMSALSVPAYSKDEVGVGCYLFHWQHAACCP